MKKVLIITFLLLLAMSVSVGAAQVGDKIGEAVFSDITAYINNYPIPSYVINNYAVIIAEDLRDYGCDVVYDNLQRTLSITKSSAENDFNAPLMYKTSMETGEYFTDVLYTDIKTYVNGNEVTSFNVNGRTMIVIDQFGKYMDGYTWNGEARAAQAWLAGKKTAEYKPIQKRTEKIFQQEEDFEFYKNNYIGWYDFNFDGTSEKINVYLEECIDYTTDILVSIGSYSKRIKTYGATLESIYLCDIDLTDGVKDLVIITVEDSSDPVARIIRFDKNLTQYKFRFYNEYDDEYYELDENWTGYVENHYFNVNDDGTITFREQTPSMGMWHVYRTYKRNAQGKFEEIVPSYYTVLPEEYDLSFWEGGFSDYEIDMWRKGYIRAYTKYYGDGVVINKGDYFRVLYDNGKNYIYIEKTNGQAGWIYVTWDTNKLNEVYFTLAG